MANVLDFRPSPLSPFVGTWLRDPLSVSRNKVVKGRMGPEGLKKLWDCSSMQERMQYLATDPELAQRYEEVRGLGRQGQMTVTLQTVEWINAGNPSLPDTTRVNSIVRVETEGRKVIVHTSGFRSDGTPRKMGYEFRMSKGWLLVSERYYGREAQFFPRSPVHRYYAVT